MTNAHFCERKNLRHKKTPALYACRVLKANGSNLYSYRVYEKASFFPTV
ncbi:hypothetical protein BAXH7_01054 [Bacillus amyloliquefaciens XH7]|nr:hypothetical protein LL3_01159 [Bacillus amyloliquefaciens LL3]AEK88196.1 hypothetical protein BAXH7_01054 [Bacillus amyloliquefaciens XH7]KYC92768.1 hypothetical protein B425_1101 [Bacillus amyloliquefaciens]